MAYNAETVTVELLAKVDGFDSKVKTSAAGFDASMKKIESSAQTAENQIVHTSERTSRSLGQIQQGTRNLGFQISDIGTQLSAGTSPFLVLAQQGPQVANALDGAGGAVGRFASFLSGPWGAAMLAAVSILGVLIEKHLKFGNAVDDAVEKLKKEAKEQDIGDKAKEKFGKTLEGVTQAINDQAKALDKLAEGEKSAAERDNLQAKNELQRIVRIRETTKALLEQADAEYDRQVGLAGGDPSGGQMVAGAALERQRVKDNLATANADLAKAISDFDRTRIRLADELGKANADPRGLLSATFDDQIKTAQTATGAAIKAARAAGKNTGDVANALVKTIADIERARTKALADYDKTHRESSADAKLPPVTGAEIARTLGTSITSGTRSAAKNEAVGGAKNSYHLIGQAIDIPLTVNGKPLTKAGIRAALAPLGVEIKELLGPGDKGHDDHFHIAFSKKRLGPDQVADASAKAAEEAARAIVDEEHRRQAFENERANLEGDEIDARKQLVVAAEEIAKLETQAIEVSRAKYDDNLTSLVDQKKLTAEEAKELRKLNDERARLRTELVARREDQRKFRIAEADAERKLQSGLADDQVEEDRLRSAESVATTAKARRDIEQRLIDLAFDEEKLQLQAIIAKRDRLKIELERLATLRALSDDEKAELQQADDRAKNAEDRLKTLPERKQNATTSNDKQNAGPLQSYFNSIPNTADEINQALENVAAGGLATFTDALTDAIVNFKSLGDVGLTVLRQLTADIVKLALQQIILHTIGAALGTAAVATTTAQAAAAGAAWAAPAALASLATLGANAGPAAAALAGTTALAVALGATPKKEGGAIFGPGGPTDDKVLIAASNGEYMIKSKSVAKLGRDVLDHINLTGTLPVGRADGGPIGIIRPSNASAAPAGHGGSGGMSDEHMNRLEFALRDAVASLPDIHMHPTLAFADALERSLNSPRGSRVFFDFMSNNSGKVSSTISR